MLWVANISRGKVKSVESFVSNLTLPNLNIRGHCSPKKIEGNIESRAFFPKKLEGTFPLEVRDPFRFAGSFPQEVHGQFRFEGTFLKCLIKAKKMSGLFPLFLLEIFYTGDEKQNEESDLRENSIVFSCFQFQTPWYCST